MRYAWARNPIGNAVNSSHHERTIPIPSFRTDDWDWPEAPFNSEGNKKINKHKEQIRDLRNRARKQRKTIKQRIVVTRKNLPRLHA